MQCIICIVIPWLIPYWPVAARMLVGGGVLVTLLIGDRQAGWWGPRRLIRVIWQQSGRWLLQFPSGTAAANWELTDRSYVTSWLMVLRWRDGPARAQLLILPGELRGDAWRQWQARLKLQATERSASHQSMKNT